VARRDVCERYPPIPTSAKADLDNQPNKRRDMETNGKQRSDVIVLHDYFGMKPLEKSGEFKAEVDALSPVEKAALAEGIRNASLTY